MSLLEDIFLGDEANEAQELERVIDGDDYDERPQSRSNSEDNSEKEDEAEEDKRRVDPSTQKAKKVVKNPRFTLNPARLTGPRGIQVIPEQFKDFKFRGKGHEKEDLDVVLKKLEHWAYRLYPKYQFEDCLKKIETLGKKQPVKVHLHRIRTDQLLSHETVVQKDSSDDEKPETPQEEDEFDKLLQQQIELARATPAPGSVKKGFMTPAEKSFIAPRATSSPSINDEQRERMIRNRQLAEERRLARLKSNSSANVTIDLSEQCVNNRIDEEMEEIDTAEPKFSKNMSNVQKSKTIDLTAQDNIEVPSKHTLNSLSNAEDIIVLENEVAKPRKVNRSNVIDSSDDECDVIAVNHSVIVDIHENVNVRNDSQDDSSKNKEDTANKNSEINADIIEEEGEMEICTETNTSTKDNKEANSEDVSGINTEVINVNSDVISTADDMSTIQSNQIESVHTVNDINMEPAEVISSTYTEDISSVNVLSEANNKDIENTEGINIENTKDIMVNGINVSIELGEQINENNIDNSLKPNIIIPKETEQNLISSENDKFKNIGSGINKENVDANIAPEQNINEELMDCDFSEEF